MRFLKYLNEAEKKIGNYIIVAREHHVFPPNIEIQRKDGVSFSGMMANNIKEEEAIKKASKLVSFIFVDNGTPIIMKTPNKPYKFYKPNKPTITRYGKFNIGLVKTEYSPFGKAYKKAWGCTIWVPTNELHGSSGWVVSEEFGTISHNGTLIFKNAAQCKKFIKNWNGFVVPIHNILDIIK